MIKNFLSFNFFIIAFLKTFDKKQKIKVENQSVKFSYKIKWNSKKILFVQEIIKERIEEKTTER